MLDLNDIVVFARVVEAGSFTAAARLLGMPKTTVSRRIAALEREVGVRLVQRTTRSLNMTDAGRLYYEQSSQALWTIEDANLRLADKVASRPCRPGRGLPPSRHAIRWNDRLPSR
jgi:DNA-binding transcriptional LysR family regulator